MIVALARKLLIALSHLVTTGEVPDGVGLRPSSIEQHHEQHLNEKDKQGSALTAFDGPVADNDPGWRQSELGYGWNAAGENGPAA